MDALYQVETPAPYFLPSETASSRLMYYTCSARSIPSTMNVVMSRFTRDKVNRLVT